MATNQLSRVVQSLRRAMHAHEGGHLSDGQLLESYVVHRQETAFAALVRRHGPMVWGVCRRVLRSHHDAEDAFQATFLVLVRKAASVVSRDVVANWLYGVAHLTALKARARKTRREQKEKQVNPMPEPALPEQQLWDDLQPLLDRELSRLPDKYRTIIVLCDLEGKTRKEAAQQLRLPEGTVASRLAAARALLAKRLGRHGLPVSGAALATVLAQNVASAGVPTSVASSTIEAARLFAVVQAAATGVISVKAVALAEGVLKTMLLTKLKLFSAVLFSVIVLGTGLAALRQQDAGAQPPPERARQVQAEPSPRQTQDAARPANAAPKDGPAVPRVVGGVIKAVDVERRTLTVTTRDGDSLFNVLRSAQISIDCKPGELSRLPAGANVSLSEFLNASTPGHIQANGSSIFSSVQAVDVNQGTITAKSEQPQGRTFRVTPDTLIFIDGNPGKLAGIPQGANLHALNLCVDQQTTCSINAEGQSAFNLRVKGVDAARNTIAFDADKAPPEVAGKTLPLAKNAEIRVDGKDGKLAAVPPGAFVNLVLTVNKESVRRMDVFGPHLGECGGSEVRAIDPDRRTITFSDRATRDVAGKTFTVAGDALLVIDGKGAQLKDLPAGAFANLVLSVDQQTVRQLHASGPRIEGFIKAVDAGNRRVIVNDTTYPLVKDAAIAIDNRRVELGDVRVNSHVTLSLHVDRRTVGMINGKGP